MLIEFSVENFRSFKERMTLSMVANDSEELLHSNTVSAGKKLRLLKSAAIYGANASGKSNLVKALEFMGMFIISSAKDTQTGEKLRFEPFLLDTSEWNKPSLFEITFLVDGTRYRYGFQLNDRIIVTEWLFHQQKNSEKALFTREGSIFTLSNAFKEAKGLEPRTRDNALFLSVLAQFNVAIANTILGQVGNFIIFQDTIIDKIFGNALLSTKLPDNALEIESFLSYFNLGFTGLSIRNSSLKELTPKTDAEDFNEFTNALNDYLSQTKNNSFRVFLTKHNVLDTNNIGVKTIDFSLEQQESEGTKKIVAFAYTFIRALQQGLCVIFDEIDNSLHPILSRKIIELFNNSETNPNGAQLIFTTHDTNLLSRKLLRRDQIWFTEKMPHGATDLYSLADFEVNEEQSAQSASYSNDYLLGKYGAIPYLGDISALFGGKTHE
ncbi:MAG: AAA family ATPase [Candidatus Kapaibacteriota bacterium]